MTTVWFTLDIQRLRKWKMKTGGIFLSVKFIQGGCLCSVYIIRRSLWIMREWKQCFSTNQPRRWSKLEICKFGFAADRSSTMVIRSKNCTEFTSFRFGRKVLLSSFHPRIKQEFKQRSSAVFLWLLNSTFWLLPTFPTRQRRCATDAAISVDRNLDRNLEWKSRENKAFLPFAFRATLWKDAGRSSGMYTRSHANYVSTVSLIHPFVVRWRRSWTSFAWNSKHNATQRNASASCQFYRQ